MNASRPGSADRLAELRAEKEAWLQQQRQRPLPAWLESRRNRRALALAPLVTFVLGVVVAAAGDGLTGLALMLGVMVLGAVTTVLLRRVTRMLDAAPEALLDEREVSQRDRAYRRGFHLTTALLGALTLLAVLDDVWAEVSTGRLFREADWIHLMLVSSVAASMLPAAVLAWTWQAPLDLDD